MHVCEYISVVLGFSRPCVWVLQQLWSVMCVPARLCEQKICPVSPSQPQFRSVAVAVAAMRPRQHFL